MTYANAIRFLYDLRWFGAKFGLANTCKLAELAGNPQSGLRFIHVAGTNGKGSTCAMLESIYRQAGLRVGLFTSPHLVAFAERIQVNRRQIPEADVARLAAEMQRYLEAGWAADQTRPAQAPGVENHPTFFEVVTVMALRYFAEQKCDLVVWETGLGGRLDSTNIVRPLASVITNIQYDHQKYLGETLASIAAEKAGIIKPGVPVITGTDAPEALRVIEAVARQHPTALTVVTASHTRRPPLNKLKLPLLGKHQRMNAAVALATVRAVQDEIPVSDDTIRAGLLNVYWPGRLQLIEHSSGQKILLDAAHNTGGAEMLAEALKEYFPSTMPDLVLGILRDKDWPEMCQVLAPLAGKILLVPVHSERTAEPHGLAEACRLANPLSVISEFPSLQAALADAARDRFVVVAGSLYLIGEAMELLGVSPGAARDERGLNEWGAGAPNR